MKKRKVFRGWMTETFDPCWHGKGKHKKLLAPLVFNYNWRKGQKHGMGLTPPPDPREVTVTFEWKVE